MVGWRYEKFDSDRIVSELPAEISPDLKSPMLVWTCADDSPNFFGTSGWDDSYGTSSKRLFDELMQFDRASVKFTGAFDDFRVEGHSSSAGYCVVDKL